MLPITVEPNGRSYWPPIQVSMIACAINRGITRGADRCNDEWLKQLARHNVPSVTMTSKSVVSIQKLVRCLIPDYVQDDKIDHMFCAVCVNAVDVLCAPKTSAEAF